MMINVNKLQMSPFVIAFPTIISNEIKIKNLLTGDTFFVDSKYISIMKEVKVPTNPEELIQKYDFETINDMFVKELLVDSNTIWKKTNVECIEIEISTQCNWKCKYCPVSIEPKKKQIMSMDLFNLILDKAKRHPSIKYVTINSYNEPTLDIYFEDRIKAIAQSGLKLMLFTNGSLLDEKKIKLLKETNVLKFVEFNMPSVDEKKFEYLTGSTLFNHTIENIKNAIENGLKTHLCLNGTKDEQKNNLELIKSKFNYFTEFNVLDTTDRAGLVKNEYSKNINIKEDLLFGCFRVLNRINVSVEGDLFLCCEDYYQKQKFGNIASGEINELLNSPEAILMRKRVFGSDIAPSDFICRNCCNMYESKSFVRLLRKS